MEEEKKVNEIETSILENPLNNTKIDITGDLTKMVEEVNKLESTPVQENIEVKEEKEVPVIEPKAVNEAVVPVEVKEVETKVETVTTPVENAENKIDTSVHDGTVITTVNESSNSEDKPEVEKKRLPVNLLAILLVIIFCVILGFILWDFFRNEDGSFKEEFFDSLSNEENKNDNTDKPVDSKPVVTPSDDIIVTPSDEVVYTFKSGKYIFNNRTLYLNNDNTFYYVTDENGCVSGNYGTYTVDGNMIDLTSTKYYDCTTCEEKTDSNLNSYVFNIRNENTISLNREVFDYVGSEESSNLFVCNNENAN